MGTRSLTVFKEANTEYCVMYRQFDGYPSGHGRDLEELLAGIKMVNGYTGKGLEANGMGCLVAQVIAHFKKGVGGFYVHPAGTRGVWEEYIYTVYITEPTGDIRLKVEVPVAQALNQLFDGTVNEFEIWLDEYEKEEE